MARLTLFTRALLALSLASCSGDALIREFNDTPIAAATVIDPRSGMMVQSALDGSLAPVTFPYAGAPVRLTLDGSGSRDPDGEIRAYRWLSGTRSSDGGLPRPPLRRIPSGEEPGWPGDQAMTTVELEPGVWSFTLWVRDDDDAWSNPDTIRIVISAPGGGSDAGAAPSAAMDGGIRTEPPAMDGGA